MDEFLTFPLRPANSGDPDLEASINKNSIASIIETPDGSCVIGLGNGQVFAVCLTLREVQSMIRLGYVDD